MLETVQSWAMMYARLNDDALAIAARELGKARSREEVDGFWSMVRATYLACEPHVQGRMRRLRLEALDRIDRE